MCDDDSLDDMVASRLRQQALSRRTLGTVALGAGLVACAPAASPSSAVETTDAEVTLKTPDGTCDAYFVHPLNGAHAAVLVWPDIFGLRPAFREMGKRLAQSGYAVLVVNPFYRVQKAPTAPEHPNFDDPETRKMLMGLAGTLTPETEVTDARTFVAWLDQQPAVDRAKKMGTTGYCMGGPLVMRTAASVPDRIGAAATFHGGGLVTDKPDSPHLLIPQMKAKFLIAIAANDDAKQPDAKDKLKAGFAQASLPAEIEVYAGTQHGWCPPDSHVYDRAAAEKAWSRQLALFRSALG
jgi:carboxymethylenebutenolidase